MTMLLPILALLPLAGALASWAAGRASAEARRGVLTVVTAAETILAAWAFALALSGQTLDWRWEGFCQMGLHLRLDGFRALYALIAAFMWLGTGLFSGEYFAGHGKNQGRYVFFTLLTLCGTVGLFLSASLYSAFIFFEIMSMASYAWVAHDEKEAAMRAAETYLAVAVIGGMATLMGLFLLYRELGTLEMDAVRAAFAGRADKTGLYLTGALIASGFLAKAGAFPAHIWLPKAHPVAPAPASALLSGVLTKTGVFGLIAVSADLFPADEAWGNAVLALGVVTMLLGALLALFSIDLKRTLACSSMSQIGFILVGLGTRCLLGEEGGLAAYGTVMHMMNHSLIKLTLFLCAGAVYMRLHALDLNAVRGFGRGRPVLLIAFLLGTLGIMGVPGGNGYVSKSLIHEAILEYVAIAPAGLRLWYSAAEKLFLLAGGLTAAYMTKLFVCLFLEKGEGERAEKKSFRFLSAAVLIVSALILPALGLLPRWTLERAAEASLPFLNASAPEHAIAYFSGENLQGAAISLAIGAAVYFGVVRTWLMRRDESGRRVYVDRWPAWLDLEKGLYRPMLEKVLPAVGGFCATIGDRFFETALARVLKPVAYFLTRAADEAADSGALLMMDTVFRRPEPKKPVAVGSHFTYRLGTILNACARALNRTILRGRPIKADFVAVLAASRDETSDVLRRVTRSVSFGLLLLCVCMYVIFAYLLTR